MEPDSLALWQQVIEMPLTQAHVQVQMRSHVQGQVPDKNSAHTLSMLKESHRVPVTLAQLLFVDTPLAHEQREI